MSAAVAYQERAIVVLENFSKDDFKCKCCGKDETKAQVKIALQAFRSFLCVELKRDIRLVINCAYRCPKHNAELDGASKVSQHMEGLAVDMFSPDLDSEALAVWATRFPLWRTVLWYPKKHFVHADCRVRDEAFYTKMN